MASSTLAGARFSEWDITAARYDGSLRGARRSSSGHRNTHVRRGNTRHRAACSFGNKRSNQLADRLRRRAISSGDGWRSSRTGIALEDRRYPVNLRVFVAVRLVLRSPYGRITGTRRNPVELKRAQKRSVVAPSAAPPASPHDTPLTCCQEMPIAACQLAIGPRGLWEGFTVQTRATRGTFSGNTLDTCGEFLRGY